MNSFLWFSCLVVSLLSLGQFGVSLKAKLLVRKERFLIFPRQAPTRYQFIAGIGIPVDLSYESVTIGYVLKTEFWLPYNATDFRQNIFFPEYRGNNENNHGREKKHSFARELLESPTGLRWDIYTYLMDRLNRYGYDGHNCLLKAICEVSSPAYMTDYLSVHDELLTILFRPSRSLNFETVESKSFKKAEETGQSGQSCKMYECELNLTNLISKVFIPNTYNSQY